MKKAVLQLETLVCPSCSMKIEGALKSITGIDKERVYRCYSMPVKSNYPLMRLKSM